MNRLFLLIILLTLAIGCNRDNKDQISVSPLRAAHTFEASSGTISVISSIKWSATSDAQWITINSTTTDAIHYSLSLNRGEARSAVIVISGGSETHNVLIEQAASGNHPLRAFDSMALVAFAKECDGANWYLGYDTIPHPWEFAQPITKWEGVATSVIDGQLRVVALNLSGVGVKGELPKELADLTQLQVLILRQNEIQGNVISLCAQLPELLYLDLARNEFINFEDAPPYGSFGKLQVLDLSVCPIKGEIPRWALLPTLSEFSIASSQIIGEIPSQISAMSNLTKLDLSDNQFTGTIPQWITSLTKLTFLDLATNRLTGEIPVKIGNLTSLNTLKFACNQLSGTIPQSIGSISNLEILNLSDNKFTTLPHQITQCRKLKYFDASFNNIEGELDANWATLNGLEYLMVVGNRMTGIIPDALLNDPRWDGSWVAQSLICPQQEGYGFSNNPYARSRNRVRLL